MQGTLSGLLLTFMGIAGVPLRPTYAHQILRLCPSDIWSGKQVGMNDDSSTGCEREMFGNLQYNNRVRDALIITINVKIFRTRRKFILNHDLLYSE